MFIKTIQCVRHVGFMIDFDLEDVTALVLVNMYVNMYV